MTLQTQRVQTLEQVRRVAEGNEPVDFALADRASAYEFIRRTLVQFDYAALGKADKSAVKAYLAKMTGLLRAQCTRADGTAPLDGAHPRPPQRRAVASVYRYSLSYSSSITNAPARSAQSSSRRRRSRESVAPSGNWHEGVM